MYPSLKDFTNQEMAPSLRLEKKLWAEGYQRVIGFDEVGRGSLAGPVTVVGCIISPTIKQIPLSLKGVNDSKKLTPRQRERLFYVLNQSDDISWGVSSSSAKIIDKVGITKATEIAMLKIIKKLSPVDFVIMDGGLSLPSFIQQCSLVRADSSVFSVASASILAKVKRDKLMRRYHNLYPQYNFKQHKGYGTVEHRKAIVEFGFSPIHRQTFHSSWQAE